jgi:Tfp pilus assembly protein FimV
LEVDFWKLSLTGTNGAEILGTDGVLRLTPDIEQQPRGDDSSRARPLLLEAKKRLSLVDVDSYFASYRNYFNVCSYHISPASMELGRLVAEHQARCGPQDREAPARSPKEARVEELRERRDWLQAQLREAEEELSRLTAN